MRIRNASALHVRPGETLSETKSDDGGRENLRKPEGRHSKHETELRDEKRND